MEILTTALSVLIVIVVAHFVIFWVVRTMYPPAPVPVQTYTQPAVIQQPEPQQNVVIPTYEAPVPVEAPRKEEQPRGPPPPEATSIHGNPGMDTANAQ